LPFVNQRIEPQLLACELIKILRERRLIRNDVLTHTQEVSEVAGDRVGLGTQVGNNGTKHDGRAHRLQRVFRPHQKRRWRLSPDALKCSQNLNDHVAPFFERLLEELFSFVERVQTQPCRLDLAFDAADAGCRVDELFIERSPVLADRGDLRSQLCLTVRRLPLLSADGVKLLIMLL
jgi:hypothetical protein